MQNRFFYSREKKSVEGFSNKKKVEEQWKKLTQRTGSNPAVEYRQDTRTIIRRKSALLQEKSETQKISINELRVFKSIFQEIQKQSQVFEKIALGLESLKDIVSILDKIFEKISIRSVKEESNFKADEVYIKYLKVEDTSRLSKKTTHEVYNKIKNLRKNNTWSAISMILNSQQVPTLSGKGKWTPELIKYFIDKMEKNKVNTSRKKPFLNKPENRKKLYNLIGKMRKRNNSWIIIAQYLNANGISTLSGKTNWTKDNTRLAFKGLEKKEKSSSPYRVEDHPLLHLDLPKKDIDRKQIYKLILKMRSKGILWYKIAEYFTEQAIPTLSGKKVWNQDNAKEIFRRLKKNTNIKQN